MSRKPGAPPPDRRKPDTSIMESKGVELFDNLAKIVPLRPLKTDEEYARACEQEAMLLGYDARGPVAQLYLDILSLFMRAYEGGLRVS